MKTYRIYDYRADGRTHYVSAPKGYYRKADGTIAKDGTPSPEMTDKAGHIYHFKTHRSAALTLAVMGPTARIR